jgi:hypothetical protein
MSPVRYGIIAVLILTLGITIFTYPALPDMIPSHWNMAGEVDGYLPKIWGVLIIPVMSVLLTGLFFLLPRIDPLKENTKFSLRRVYPGVPLSLIPAQIILWGSDTGYPTILPLATGDFSLFDSGRHASRIRLGDPWTLSSKEVGKKTRPGRKSRSPASLWLVSFGTTPGSSWSRFCRRHLHHGTHIEYQRVMKGTPPGERRISGS